MPGLPQTIVDFVRLVEIRVVDQTLPADGGAWLFEVPPHHDVQLVRVLFDGRLQQRSVFTCSFGVVNRTWPNDDQQAAIVAAQDVRDLLARLEYRGRSLLRGGKFLLEEDRRQYDFDPSNSKLLSGKKNGRALVSLRLT